MKNIQHPHTAIMNIATKIIRRAGLRRIGLSTVLGAMMLPAGFADDTEVFFVSQPNVLLVIDTSLSMNNIVGDTKDSKGEDKQRRMVSISIGDKEIVKRHEFYVGDQAEVTEPQRRIDVVVDAITELINRVSDVNIGLMRFSTYNGTELDRPGDNAGGPVSYPVVDLDEADNKRELKKKLESLAGRCEGDIYIHAHSETGKTGQCPATNPASPPGSSVPAKRTPLAETVYEGLRYFRGEPVLFGKPVTGGLESKSHEAATVDSDEDGIGDGVTYKSPIIDECAANFMVLLTDGAPVGDFEAVEQINTLIKGQPYQTCEKNRNCLDDLAYFMRNYDQSPLTGKQNITSYYIGGFLEDKSFAQRLLDQSAKVGGSKQAFAASSPGDFANAFNQIIRDIKKSTASFGTPGVMVDSANRLQHNDEIYFALFEPGPQAHWNGNLKKYWLKTATATDGRKTIRVVDKKGKEAITADGLFKKNAVSDWALADAAPDGNETTAGGIANRLFNYKNKLHDAESRRGKVFTWLRDYSPNDPSFKGTGLALHRVDEAPEYSDSGSTDVSATHLTRSALGLCSEIDGTRTCRISDKKFEKRVKWLRGVDVLDENGNEDLTDGRAVMGGLLHTRPVVVNLEPDDPNTKTDETRDMILVTSNDGYFHLFKTADPGSDQSMEYAAVIPKPVLKSMEELYRNKYQPPIYTLDGQIAVWRHDDDDDGEITSGKDRIVAYFGQRRGGRAVFAFDVTAPATPKLLWVIDPDIVDSGSIDSKVAPFLRMGQSWPKPGFTYVRVVDSGKLVEKPVIILNGGYDAVDDRKEVKRNDVPVGHDTVGNAVYIVDALTGELLWWAGKGPVNSSSPDLVLPDMKYGFAANMRIVDLNGDGLADMLFSADGGGQVWRFDINNIAAVGGLKDRITGGVIADLQIDQSGTGASPTRKNNRRTYYAPDVALIQQDKNGPVQLALAIGTGLRAGPLDTTIHDRLYLLKYADITRLPDYSAIKLHPDMLLDVTKEDFAAASVLPTLESIGRKNLENNGWYINLFNEKGQWVGEKSLAKAAIFNNKVFFTTYTPPSKSTECGADRQGTGKVYVMDVFDARSVYDFDGITSTTERSKKLQAVGIPPAPKIHFGDKPAAIVSKEVLPNDIIGDGTSSGSPFSFNYWIQEGAQK